MRRDHRVGRYASKISRELAQEASRLHMTPPSNINAAANAATETVVVEARTLLRRLRDCCHYRLPE